MQHVSTWDSISQVKATPGGDEHGRLALNTRIYHLGTTRVHPSQLLAPVVVFNTAGGDTALSCSSNELSTLSITWHFDDPLGLLLSSLQPPRLELVVSLCPLGPGLGLGCGWRHLRIIMQLQIFTNNARKLLPLRITQMWLHSQDAWNINAFNKTCCRLLHWLVSAYCCASFETLELFPSDEAYSERLFCFYCHGPSSH